MNGEGFHTTPSDSAEGFTTNELFNKVHWQPSHGLKGSWCSKETLRAIIWSTSRFTTEASKTACSIVEGTFMAIKNKHKSSDQKRARQIWFEWQTSRHFSQSQGGYRLMVIKSNVGCRQEFLFQGIAKHNIYLLIDDHQQKLFQDKQVDNMG